MKDREVEYSEQKHPQQFNVSYLVAYWMTRFMRNLWPMATKTMTKQTLHWSFFTVITVHLIRISDASLLTAS